MKVRRSGDIHLTSAYQDLKNALCRFEFKPGQKLVIADLADHYNVSNTPIREILNRLHAEGFIDFQPGTGFSCKTPDISEVEELYSLLFCLTVNAVETSKAESVLICLEAEIQFLQSFEKRLGDQDKHREAVAMVEDMDREIIVPLLAAGKAVFANIAENALIRTRLIRAAALEQQSEREDLISHLEGWTRALQSDRGEARRLVRMREQKVLRQLPQLVRQAIARIYIP